MPFLSLAPSAPLPSPFLPVLTAEAMREADRLTIEAFGLPGFTLMETASRAAADQIERRYGPLEGKTITFFCGKGNNGGDGLAAARVLYSRGARIRAFTLGEAEAMTGDAAHNLKLLRQLAEQEKGDRLLLARYESPDQVAGSGRADVYVDALLGTGLTSALREPICSLVDWLNRQAAPTVALDMPTGLHSDTGTVLGTAVQADLTVTMGALKAGLLLGAGKRLAGQVAVVDIGIPAFLFDRVRQQPGCARCATDRAVGALLPERGPDAHKYSVGLALVVAGAPGLTGAPVMAATAAARAGAGAVVCACPEAAQPTLAAKLTEVMTLALPAGADGIDPKGALEALSSRLEKAQALLIGPGLGRDRGTQRFVHELLRRADLPLVIDADGLNALAGHTDLLTRHARGRWILTPHAGEFARLAGSDVDLTDRIGVAQAYARRWNCVLVLKGMPSVIGCPDGQAYVNATGGPALATAGTGDVLAGLCTGLLAQGLPPAEAAVCALHLGGAAADRYSTHHSPRTMLATDLLDELPAVLDERF